MYWVPPMPDDYRNEFVAYLRQIAEEPKTLHFVRLRIEQIHIPVADQEGEWPESLDFAQLAESLGTTATSAHIEFLEYIQYFDEYRSHQRVRAQ